MNCLIQAVDLTQTCLDFLVGELNNPDRIGQLVTKTMQEIVELINLLDLSYGLRWLVLFRDSTPDFFEYDAVRCRKVRQLVRLPRV